MNENIRNISNIIVACVIIFGLSIFCFIKSPDKLSVTERRKLEQMPELNIASILSTDKQKSFMNSFEKYTADQFPMRENFRMIHSLFSKYALGRLENEDLYVKDGYIFKLDYKINEDSVNWSLNRFNYINDNLSNNKMYFAIIPDKAYYSGSSKGNKLYPLLDYDTLFDRFINETKDFAEFIDLRDSLSLSNYYYTDTHWKQETLVNVASVIAKSMNTSYNFVFEENFLIDNFKGVYYGQLALPIQKDTIKYFTGDYIDNLKVTCYDSGKAEEIGVYNFEASNGLDPYEFFLSGSKSLITIENPSAKTDKELVIFRDSFGSSIAPLLAGNYSKLTLVDIRYISPAMVNRFVDFEKSDILLLYSMMVLNNSMGQFN